MEDIINHQTLQRLADGNWHDSYKSNSARIIKDIIALHQPYTSNLTNPPTDICGCDQIYPCNTIKLIYKELTEDHTARTEEFLKQIKNTGK